MKKVFDSRITKDLLRKNVYYILGSMIKRLASPLSLVMSERSIYNGSEKVNTDRENIHTRNVIIRRICKKYYNEVLG